METISKAVTEKDLEAAAAVIKSSKLAPDHLLALRDAYAARQKVIQP
jgi:hypothetical protein